MNGFLVRKKVRAVILSYKANLHLRDFINSLDITIIDSIPMDIDKRIADHPDLQIHPISQELFIASPNSYDYYKRELSKYGKKVIKGSINPGNIYPKDTIYNISRVGPYFIGKTQAIDEIIYKEYKQLGYKLLEVNQGYAKCMTIPLDGGIITCDKGIYKILKKNKVKSYYIESEEVVLDGFPKGFIGGASGFIDRKSLLFTGDIRKSNSYKDLMDISHKEGIDLIFPNYEKIIDLGSIIPIE